MGYQDVDLYKLVFEDRPGLEVTAEGVSTGDLFEVMDVAGAIPEASKDAKLDPESKKALIGVLGQLAGALEEWNVEDRHGEPVPMTVAGLLSLKPKLMMDILTAWISAQTNVDDDLGKGSGSGGTSALEQSIPMEPRSPNPGS
jgi:hypothetical protein